MDSVTLVGGPYSSWVVAVDRGADEWALETVTQVDAAGAMAEVAECEMRGLEPRELVSRFPDRYVLRRDCYQRIPGGAVFEYLGRQFD